MKKKYTVDSKSLCPNCAAKIESKLKDIDGVEDANLSAITLKLKLDVADDADLDYILEESNRIANKIEPGTVFVER